MLNTIALANTVAIIDLVLRPLFHFWISISPSSYEWAMNLFVAGLHLEVNEFDTGLSNIILGTVVEASVFWALGFAFAWLYNHLQKR